MSGFITFVVFITVLGGMLLAHYIDAKYDRNFFAWFSGENVNPFEPRKSNHKVTQSEHISALKNRIETLETIVTEPAYELNKKINQL